MTQPDAAFVVAHFEARDASMIMATLDALAITQLKLDLCSARRSRLGHYVMAGE
jgi:hypothetical protein